MTEYDFVQDPTQGWTSPPLRGEAVRAASGIHLRIVAKASTAHEVPMVNLSEQRTSPDVRMMRATI